jgi:hypothetical protein
LREFKELGESEQALLPIEESSLLTVETSESSYSDAQAGTSDLTEGESLLGFDVETAVEEPVEQA